MRMLTKTKTLILHIPRCGGTWIEQAIGRLDLSKARCLHCAPTHLPRKHLTLGHIRRSTLTQTQSIAAFVRHPISYYESTWRFMARQGHAERRTMHARWHWHPQSSAAKLFDRDFNTWIKRMMIAEPMWVSRMFEQYVGPEGGEFCNFIGRQESLQADFIALLRHIGREVKDEDIQILNQMPRHNIGGGSMPEWSTKLRREVAEMEAPAIRRFYALEEHRRIYVGVHKIEATEVAAG